MAVKRGKEMKQKEIKVTVKKSDEKLTMEQFVSIVFGKMPKTLVNEILENKDGRYDALFGKGESR